MVDDVKDKVFRTNFFFQPCVCLSTTSVQVNYLMDVPLSCNDLCFKAVSRLDS